MAEIVRTIQDYAAEVLQADYERTRQAGWLAMCELKTEIAKCSSMEDINAWVERVNARAEEILRRVN